MMATANPNHAELCKRVRQFVVEEVYPLEPLLLGRAYSQLLPRLEEKRRRAREQGLWVPHIPKESGGLGFSVYDFGQFSEVLGSSPLGHYVCNCQAPDAGNMELLLHSANTAQRTEFLAPLLNGEIRSCFAMTEPEHAGSNPVWLSTTAVRDGDSYVINGHKWFVTAAEGAAFVIVMAVTDPNAVRAHQRASMIIVPMSAPGLQLVRNIPVMGEAGEGYFSHGELRFQDCRVPRANLLGVEGEGFRLAQSRLGPGRIHHCMRWIGICERALAMMCRYAGGRELEPGQPLTTKQTVQAWIAESRAEIDAARLLVLETAATIDREDAVLARVAISMIKFFAAGVMQRVLDHALQVHGALGMTDDTVLAFFYRHERAARIYDGPDEVHKSVVARAELKKRGAYLNAITTL